MGESCFLCGSVSHSRQANCCLKRRALHPNACSAGLLSLHSWVQLGSFLHAMIGREIIFTAQKRYRAPPRSPGQHTRPVRHCPRALPAKLQFVCLLRETDQIFIHYIMRFCGVSTKAPGAGAFSDRNDCLKFWSRRTAVSDQLVQILPPAPFFLKNPLHLFFLRI